MTHAVTDLRRLNTITLAGNRLVHHFDCATNDTKAELLTAGYFNNSRAALTVGSWADCVVDVDGTPTFVRVIFTAVPSSGNVTVALAQAPAT